MIKEPVAFQYQWLQYQLVLFGDFLETCLLSLLGDDAQFS